MLEPNSPLAQSIADLFTLTHLIGLAIFALVAGLVLYMIVRFRAKPGQEDPKPIYGNTLLELTWIIGPTLIVIFLFVLVFITANESDPDPEPNVKIADLITASGGPDSNAVPVQTQAPGKAATQPDIIVIGHQWWWEIQYPGSKVVTANEIHMPTGKHVLLQVQSADVAHDLWVGQLGRKMDMLPGQANYVTWQANTPGVFDGACAEYCGTEHAWMRVRVIAQTQSDFDAWQAAQAAPAQVTNAANIAHGAQVFQQKTCISCHAILGANANAVAGPSLSHIGSRTTIGAGIMNNDAASLTAWIRNPQAVKPGVHMPVISMLDSDLTYLVSYLESLK